LDQVGMLDPEFFMYGEETDLQYRLQRAGWSIRFVPDVTTIHHGGVSQDRWRRRRMVYRGKLLFYRKNYSAVRAGMLRVLLGLATLSKLPVWLLAAMLPRVRSTAVRELKSNLHLLKLCADPSLSYRKAPAS
jgi:GT2 family glycosyltransferase